MIDTSIIEEYLNGKSLSFLSKKLGISTAKLKKELQNKGIKIRTRNEQNKYNPQNQRKYKINDLYFSISDTVSIFLFKNNPAIIFIIYIPLINILSYFYRLYVFFTLWVIFFRHYLIK